MNWMKVAFTILLVASAIGIVNVPVGITNVTLETVTETEIVPVFSSANTVISEQYTISSWQTSYRYVTNFVTESSPKGYLCPATAVIGGICYGNPVQTYYATFVFVSTESIPYHTSTFASTSEHSYTQTVVFTSQTTNLLNRIETTSQMMRIPFFLANPIYSGIIVAGVIVICVAILILSRKPTPARAKVSISAQLATQNPSPPTGAPAPSVTFGTATGEVFCISCGTMIPATATFCRRCGARQN